MAAKKKASKKVTKKAINKKSKPAASTRSAKGSRSAKGAKKTTKKVIKKTAKKTTKKAAKKVTKKIAKKVSKKNTKKASKTAAKKPINKTSTSKKTAKKVTRKKKTAPQDDNLIHGIEPYNEKAREKYMNPKQTDHFRDILVAWKHNLLDEVSKTIHLMQDENINHPDPNDRASQETDMSLELRNRDRERKLLKKIDSTIARVDSNDYGWCDRCGIEIGIRRLEARPTAELCVDCKTLNEIKERQMI